MQRILPCILCLAILFSLLPNKVMAENISEKIQIREQDQNRGYLQVFEDVLKQFEKIKCNRLSGQHVLSEQALNKLPDVTGKSDKIPLDFFANTATSTETSAKYSGVMMMQPIIMKDETVISNSDPDKKMLLSDTVETNNTNSLTNSAENSQQQIMPNNTDSVLPDSNMPTQEVTTTTPSSINVSVSDTVHFDGGEGTIDNPYLISTEEQLNVVKNNLSANYRLTQDITLMKEWQQIGNDFKGVFDGGGFVIDVSKMPSSDNVSFTGLFGVVASSAEIKNVKVKMKEDVNSCNVGRYGKAGGLVRENYGSITNCYVTGGLNITGDYAFGGGLVGANCGTISNCHSNVNVIVSSSNSITGSDTNVCPCTILSGNSPVSHSIISAFGGGLVGTNEESGTITGSDSNGTVSCPCAGGLVSRNLGTISKCHSSINLNEGGGLVNSNLGIIIQCYATGNVSTNSYAGGLTRSNQGTISQSYATGNVSGNYAGGLSGINIGDGTISDCYATGNVNGSGADSTGIGGLVGQNSSVIKNSYAIGNLKALSELTSVGGLVGLNECYILHDGLIIGTVINSYYDIVTSGQSDAGKGEGKDTYEMLSASTYTGWNFDNIWGISPAINGGYPYLLSNSPILGNSKSSIQINLKFDGTENPYKNMLLTLKNIDKNTKKSIFLTNNSKYIFPGLDNGDKYKVEISNQYGNVLDEVNNIILTESMKDLLIEANSHIQTVNLSVKDNNGTAITSGYTVKWYDASNNYIQQGNSIRGMVPGTILYYDILLDNDLGIKYTVSEKQKYTVIDGDNNISVCLSPIPIITIMGRVTDKKDNSPLQGTTISISQFLNGKYPDNLIVTTDKDGLFVTQIYKDKTNITVSKNNYAEFVMKDVQAKYTGDIFDIGDIQMSLISGPQITLKTSYTYSAEAGEQIKYDGYSGISDIEFTLFNQTQAKEIKGFIMQYPYITLPESANQGDVIRITARSRSGDFKPVDTIITLGNGLKAEAQIDFAQNGKFIANISSNANLENSVIVYNSNGKFVNQYDFKGETIKSNVLSEGCYDIIFIAKSLSLTRLQNISDYASLGLKENVDYSRVQVQIMPGVVTELENIKIPPLDESKLNYTENSLTSFTVNKTKAALGSYFTLRSEYAFKEEYKNKVSNIKLIFTLPENCQLITSSVLVGNGISSNYIYDKDSLAVPVLNIKDIVRLCVVPSIGGIYNVNAFLEFDMDNKTVRQPLGVVSFEAENKIINVPEKTAQKTINVSGVTIPNADVTIYDNNVMVGQTKALANGSWSIPVQLYKPYTYSFHNIYAEVHTQDGITVVSENKQLIYDISYIGVSKVTMINTAHPSGSLNLCEYDTVFDFISPKSKPQIYWYWPKYPTFTFKLEFTDNDPNNISDVSINVWTMSGNVVSLPAVFDTNKKVYIAKGDFDSNNLPVNVSVDYIRKSVITPIDMQKIDDKKSELSPLVFNDDKDDYLNSIMQELKDNYKISLNFDANNNSINFNSDIIGNFVVNMKDCSSTSKEELIKQNFTSINTTNGNDVYIKQDNNMMAVVDYSSNTYMELLKANILRKQTMKLDENSNGVEELYKCITTVHDVAEKVDQVSQSFGKGFEQAAEKILQRVAKIPMGDELKAEYLARAAKLQGVARYLKGANFLFGYIKFFDTIDKLSKLASLYNSLPKCSESEALKTEILQVGEKLSAYAVIIASKIIISLTSLVAAPGTGGSSILATLAFTITSFLAEEAADELFKWKIEQIYEKASKIPKTPNCSSKTTPKNPELPDASPLEDPSGYTYEAVTTNRLQGVTATIYYKQNLTDTTTTVWDATEYQQDNPLTTDANGVYAWDVPQGWWQVKYEKEGYQTVYSEWLPVPPPQIDVNIGMVSYSQPNVTRVSGYPDYIELIFDKYMQLSTLTTDNIKLMKNGVECKGTIEFVDAEVNPQNPKEQFAKKMHFIPSDKQFLQSDSIELTVSSNVRSYSNVNMASDYMATVPINAESKSLTITENLDIDYGGSGVINADILPGDSAIGKKITAVSSSPSIATTFGEAIVDASGKASIQVNGNMTGLAYITLKLDGTDLQAQSKINVAMPAAQIQKVSPPFSSVPSGNVPVNTQVQLSSSTEGAEIYYTTDGTCPCNSPTRQLYTGAIVITNNVTILAAATKIGMQDSDSVGFVYNVLAKEPVANINSGEVSIGTSIVLSSSMVGAKIYYTLDGSTPTSASILYTKPIIINQATTIKAIAIDNTVSSAISTYNYTIAEKVAKPIADTRAGTVNAGTAVTLSTSTQNATIYYTTDNTCPCTSSTRQVYMKPIIINQNTTIIAYAVKQGMKDSDILGASYTIKGYVSTPIAKPAAKAVKSNTQIQLSTNTDGAIIYYTTDGSTPSKSANIYMNPITITTPTRIKAIAIKEGLNDSTVLDVSYTILDKVDTPIISPSSGSVLSGTQVTITTTSTGASIYYTIDGTTPSVSSKLYTAPFTITFDTTIRAIAVKSDLSDSDITTASYTIQSSNNGSSVSNGSNDLQSVSTVIANPKGGVVEKGTKISLSTSTNNAKIYYTTDGMIPTTNSRLYTEPIEITKDTIIKAVATKSGMSNSNVLIENYIIKTETTSNRFSDISDYEWAREAINTLAEKAIIKGTGKNTFSPELKITRADYLSLMVRMLGLTAIVSDNFDDVTSDKYYYKEIGIAKALGVTTGVGDNKFHPEEPISRQDMFVLTARIMKKLSKLNTQSDISILKQYTDGEEIAAYAKSDVVTLISLGLIKGAGNHIYPKNNASRAEAAVFVWRIYEYFKK